MKNLLIAFLAVASFSLAPSASAEFVFTPEFPSGVDWMNATPDQITQAVYQAAKNNPENTIDIVTSAINAAKATQRFPSIASSDGKQLVDPQNADRTGTIEDLAERIGDAAKQANPAMAPQIDAMIFSSVPTVLMLTGTPSTDGGGGGTGGGSGGGVPLPPGFGGGGGGGSGGGSGGSGPSPDSN